MCDYMWSAMIKFYQNFIKGTSNNLSNVLNNNSPHHQTKDGQESTTPGMVRKIKRNPERIVPQDSIRSLETRLFGRTPHHQGQLEPMGSEEWRLRGKEMVDYIAEYLDTISTRRVTPHVEPGYLKALLPDSPPYKSEDWDMIMADFEKYIMPGVTHWQHPRFHAYFPAGNSFPSILADMISDAIGCIGFSWVSLILVTFFSF